MKTDDIERLRCLLKNAQAGQNLDPKEIESLLEIIERWDEGDTDEEELNQTPEPLGEPTIGPAQDLTKSPSAAYSYGRRVEYNNQIQVQYSSDGINWSVGEVVIK